MALTMKHLVYLSLILMLAGCVPTLERPSCSEIANLRAQIGKEISPESFRQWVSQTYQMPLESITVDITPNEQTHIVHWREVTRVWLIVRWEEIVQVWYAAALEQGVVDDIRVSGGSIPANKVLACLGKPAWYGAWYKDDLPGTQLSLNLLFPDQGVLAHGAKFFGSSPKQPPPISEAFPLSSFLFMQPGSVEQVLHHIYYHPTRSLYEQMLREHKPWPGRWEDIVVEIDPSLHQ